MRYALRKEKLHDKTYIACFHEVEASILMSLLDEAGYIWMNGEKLTKKTYWEERASDDSITYIIHQTSDKRVTYKPYTTSSDRHLIFEEVVYVDNDSHYPEYYADDKGHSYSQDDVKKEKDESLDSFQDDTRKENVKMNMFGFNLECGELRDADVASTIMGIAINNGNTWRVFDKSSKTMVDIGDIEMGSFPVYVLPTTKPVVGDIIKQNDEYLYITKMENGYIEAINLRTGNIENVIPIRNIIGMSLYSKLMVITDDLMNTDGDNSDMMLLMMLMQNGKESGSQNNFLPIWLYMSMKDEDSEKDGDGENNAKKKDKMLKLMTLSMAMSGRDNNQNGMMMALLMKDKLF